MLHDKLQQLWEERFTKILDIEREAFLFYKNILQNYAPLLESTRSKELLEKIAADELAHTKIAMELLRTAIGIPASRRFIAPDSRPKPLAA